MLIEVIRGDTKRIKATFKQSDGTAYNLTGGKVFFIVNRSGAPVTDTGAVISKTVTTHTDAAGGISHISLTPTDTNITPGTYWYDIQLVDVAGNVLSEPRDKFVVLSDIRRAVS